MEKVFEIYIKTTPERLWEAITDNESRQKYNFGVGVTSDWEQGSGYEGVHPGAGIAICEGENLEVDPPTPTRSELHRSVERPGQVGRRIEGDLGDRAGWQLMPAHCHP